jgi:hypothetical protein
MQLYHIQAENAEANLDWFVVANDPEQGMKLWGDYLEKHGFDKAEGTIRMRLVLKKITATRFEGGPRVIEWDSFPVVLVGTHT